MLILIYSPNLSLTYFIYQSMKTKFINLKSQQLGSWDIDFTFV